MDSKHTPRKAKRSDIPTMVVLAVVQAYGNRAWFVLTDAFPEKVVAAAFERDMAKDLVECGSTIRFPWLTVKGQKTIQRERLQTVY